VSSPEQFEFPFEGVVIVADILNSGPTNGDHLNRSLEQTDRATLNDLAAAIERLGLKVYHYEHPQILAANANRHARDIVLSIFGGAISRNRMALVPAVCESMGLAFVGPDAYGRVICQDKEVSKALALEAGLRVPQHRIVRTEQDLPRLRDFELPFVAKPLWEGSSIGVGPDSLVTETRKGIAVVRELLAAFDQPVMVESFVPGREVSYCFIDPQNGPPWRVLGEVLWQGERDYFDHHLYDASHKAMSEGRKAVHVISNELRDDDARALERLLQIVGPTGYGRIDGKLSDGEFVFLEITPDAWLGATGTLLTSFMKQGRTFDQVIAHILLSGASILPGR
jgi:D-alanine-D-alanine ligase